MARTTRKIVVSLDTYLSILAVVSSFCAIGITFYQAYLQRTQQYASVRPILDSYVNNGSHEDTYNFDFIFINNGIGPAFIKEFSYSYKGKLYGSFNEILKKVAIEQVGTDKEAALDTIKVDNIVYSSFWIDRVMPPNQEIRLVSISSNTLARWVYNAISKGDVNVKIRYASIYDEQWVFETTPAKLALRNQKVAD